MASSCRRKLSKSNCSRGATEGDVYMINQPLESVSAKARSISGQEAVTRPAASMSMSAKRLAPVEKQRSLHHRTNSFSGGYGALFFPFDGALAAWSVRSEMPFPSSSRSLVRCGEVVLLGRSTASV